MIGWKGATAVRCSLSGISAARPCVYSLLEIDPGSTPLRLCLGFGILPRPRRRRKVHFAVPRACRVGRKFSRLVAHAAPSSSEPPRISHQVLHKTHLQVVDDFPVLATRHFFKRVKRPGKKQRLTVKVQRGNHHGDQRGKSHVLLRMLAVLLLFLLVAFAKFRNRGEQERVHFSIRCVHVSSGDLGSTSHPEAGADQALGLRGGHRASRSVAGGLRGQFYSILRRRARENPIPWEPARNALIPTTHWYKSIIDTWPATDYGSRRILGTGRHA